MGSGGQGVVWKALDTLIGETVALKFYTHPLHHWDSRGIENVRKEVIRMRRLQIAGVVPVHDLIMTRYGPAVVMAYIESRSLERLLAEEGPQKPEAVKVWLPKLCRVLDRLHQEMEYVHRDLKPGNILITGEDDVYLCDFSLSRSLRPQLSGRTVTHYQMGTPAYISPQQLCGADPDPRDDIFALGVVLCEVLTGKVPYSSGNLLLRIEGKRDDGKANWWGELTQLPGAQQWRTAIAACLSYAPEGRPSRAMEVIELIDAEFDGRKRRSGLGFAFLLGLAGLVCMGVLWFGLRVGNGEPVEGDDPVKEVANEGWQRYRKTEPMFWAGSMAKSLVLHVPVSPWYASDRSGFQVETTPIAGSVPGFRGDDNGAMAFDGRNRLRVDMHPGLVFGAEDDWCLSFWIQPIGEEGTIIDYQQQPGRGFSYQLGLDGGVPQLWIHALDQGTARADKALSAGEWNHLIVWKRGKTFGFRINGEPAGETEFARLRSTAIETEPLLTIGADRSSYRVPLSFHLDEFTIWRSALSEIGWYTAFKYRPVERGGDPRSFMALLERYALIGQYSFDLGAIEPAVRERFGVGAELAEWNQFKKDFMRTGELLATSLQLEPKQKLHMRYWGSQQTDGRRAIFAEYANGHVLETYLAHDILIDRSFALGSWQSPGMPLVRLMEATDTGWRRRSMDIAAGERVGASEVLRSELIEGGKVIVVGLGYNAWMAEEGGEIRITLGGQKAQAEVRLELTFTGERFDSVRLAVIRSSGERIERTLPPVITVHGVWCVLVDGKLSLAVLDNQSVEPALALTEVIPEFETARVRNLMVERWGASLQPRWIEIGVKH